MAVSRQGGRSPYTLAVLLLSCLTLLTLDFRGFGPLENVQSGMREVLSPLRSATESITDPLVDVWDGVFDYDNVVSQNEELRSRVAELEGQILQAEADDGSYQALLEATGLDDIGDVETLIARVVSGPTGNFAQDTIEIDRGSSDGLVVGMGVATPAGLVGKLVEVDTSRSVVQLITHEDFRVGVRLTRSNTVGVARGTSEPGVLKIDQGIEGTSQVFANEPVITSGGRSLFPPEMRIGRVSDTGEDTAALVRTIEVELAASVEDLTFVNVVLFEPDQ